MYAVALAAMLAVACAHSSMTDPQGISAYTCRMGGEAAVGVPVETCPGPCDMRPIEGNWGVHFDSPDKPAAVYRRGQRVTIRYRYVAVCLRFCIWSLSALPVLSDV